VAQPGPIGSGSTPGPEKPGMPNRIIFSRESGDCKRNERDSHQCPQGTLVTVPLVRYYLGGLYMPIFEYECGKCGSTFEKLVRSSDPADTVACPGCGSKKVEQLYSAFSGRTKSASGATRSLSSGCGSCHAGSCAGCR